MKLRCRAWVTGIRTRFHLHLGQFTRGEDQAGFLTETVVFVLRTLRTPDLRHGWAGRGKPAHQWQKTMRPRAQLRILHSRQRKVPGRVHPLLHRAACTHAHRPQRHLPTLHGLEARLGEDVDTDVAGQVVLQHQTQQIGADATERVFVYR